MIVDQFCECQSSWSRCHLRVILSLEDALAIRKSGLIIIVNGCQRGPEPTDSLIELRDGYSLYRED